MKIKSRYVLVTCVIVAGIFLISEVKITRNEAPVINTQQQKGTASEKIQAKEEMGQAPIVERSLAVRESSSTSLGVFAMSMRDQLNLTDKEAQVVDEAFKAIKAKREALELSLAKREEVNEASVLIIIPEYAIKGLNLFDEFYAHISNGLGSARANELMAGLEPPFKAANNGLGAVEQKVLIEDNGASVHIVHGSGSFLDINGAIHSTTNTTTSNLLKNNLVSYAYMEPLFPSNRTNNKN